MKWTCIRWRASDHDCGVTYNPEISETDEDVWDGGVYGLYASARSAGEKEGGLEHHRKIFDEEV